MQLGLIGLGKMGNNMRERLRRAGHEVVGFDHDPSVSDVADLAALTAALNPPRVVWVMVPSGNPTQETVAALAEVLDAGDLVVDGGNSYYKDDAANAALLAARGIGYVDCGVSGGIWGLDHGYGLMCGGSDADVERLMPIFDALRPEGPRDEGFVHAGGVGAGHYAKMVHNGIEYGLMHAYAEGWELLEAKNLVTDVHGCFKAWSRGTVVRSWLLDLLVRALEETPHLAGIDEFTPDSGEGRWTLMEAIDNAVPMPMLAAALFARFASRQEESPTMQMVSALRGQFGGHAVALRRERQDYKDDVNYAARPKQDRGTGAPAGGPRDDATGEAARERADESIGETVPRDPTQAGPSSGTGATPPAGSGVAAAGPTSGSGSTD